MEHLQLLGSPLERAGYRSAGTHLSVVTVCEAIVGQHVHWRQGQFSVQAAGVAHIVMLSVLVRHLFLVDQTLDGLVLEVDASTTGVERHVGDRSRSQREPPDAFVSTEWTPDCCSRSGETLRTKQHGRRWV